MSLLQELREAHALTEREIELRDYLLNHPEQVQRMSCRQLGEATYTSAATVTAPAGRISSCALSAT